MPCIVFRILLDIMFLQFYSPSTFSLSCNICAFTLHKSFGNFIYSILFIQNIILKIYKCV